jgi:5-methylcytosine-specific restriction enzyme A
VVKQWAGTRRAELPPDWERIRRRVLQRDPVCRMCGSRDSTEVDHCGTDRLDHRDESLRGLCTPCHRRRTSAQGNAVLRKRAASKYRTPEPHPSERD